MNIRNGKRVKPSRPNRINREIKVKEVRLLGVEGEQLGVLSIFDALDKAQEAELDLVEISPTAEPPVCKIMNYGKYLYEKSKSDKEAKKKQKIVQVKEVKFRPNTDKGDYQVKLRNLIRFLEDGDKVKVTVNFRGREVTHADLGKQLLATIKTDIVEIGVPEFESHKIEGRSLTMVVAPKKKG